jgi:hypothetical protein
VEKAGRLIMVQTAKPRSALFQAAERLDHIVRDVKDKQFHATGVSEVPVEEPGALHPEEAWARRFGTHAIRPVRSETEGPPLSAFVAPPAGMPRLPVFEEPAPIKLDGLPMSGHIGSALGKPGPRRSWLRRLIHGRGI